MEPLTETTIQRAKKHKSWMFRAVVKHITTCKTCKLDTERFTLTQSCDNGASLHEEYLIARNFVTKGEIP